MAEVSATLVKELREKTGAGMMDCKKALTETGGDMESAVDWLRKKGLSAAAKKSGRVAAEGLIGVCVNGNRGAIVEVNSETDFVARNEGFQMFVRTIARLVLNVEGNLDALKTTDYPGSGRTVAEELTHMIATIGENMNLRRAAFLSVNRGVLASYVHNARAPGLGKIGVLVGLEVAEVDLRLETLGKHLAMHVAAANPLAVSREDIDCSVLQRERNVLAEQARATGKPEPIVAKMVEGRLARYYEDVCLLDQVYVIDGESKVGNVLETTARETNVSIRVNGFVRFVLGEGINKKGQDFAEEVAKTARG